MPQPDSEEGVHDDELPASHRPYLRPLACHALAQVGALVAVGGGLGGCGALVVVGGDLDGCGSLGVLVV